MGALPKEEQSFTYSDYKEWDLGVGERYELIYGEAFAMAGPGARHQAMLTEILTQFYNYLRGKSCQVFPAPFDVRLFYEEDESDDTVVQPDIMVVCDKNKIGPEGCRGAPDLVIEILSPSNTAFEMERKFLLYREAGVREYWIVDSKSSKLKVHCFRDGEIITNVYGSADAVPVAVLPGFSVALENVFAE
ncbi:MAG: Uma2 family endonuclease [Treponema sp.]|jgi:Uma2 family endonuclease|nr:Uma2 family endonuclease [Treponema sp.]